MTNDNLFTLVNAYTTFGMLSFLCLFIRTYSMFILCRWVRVYLGQTGSIALSIAIATCLSSINVGVVGSIAFNINSLNTFGLAFLVFREIAIGLFIGAPFVIACEALSMSGRLCDMFRGAQFGEQIFPGSSDQVTVLESLGVYAGGLLCLCCGGYEVVMNLLVGTVKRFACDLQVPSNFSLLSGVSLQVFCNDMIYISGMAIKSALLFSAPVLVLCIVVDSMACVLSRMLGRMNVQMELMSLKMVIGLIIVGISITYDAIEPLNSLFVITTHVVSSRIAQLV